VEYKGGAAEYTEVCVGPRICCGTKISHIRFGSPLGMQSCRGMEWRLGCRQYAHCIHDCSLRQSSGSMNTGKHPNVTQFFGLRVSVFVTDATCGHKYKTRSKPGGHEVGVWSSGRCTDDHSQAPAGAAHPEEVQPALLPARAAAAP
jgi:hypothetical protein